MLDHVGVPVRDFERSKRFYEEALSPLGYELIMEPSVSAAGFGRWGKPDFWIAQGEPGHAIHVSRSPPPTVPPLTPSTKRPSRRAGATTVVPGFAPSTTQAITAPSSSIRTATISKQSAMSQEKKPEPASPYSPNSVEGVFSEVRPQKVARPTNLTRRGPRHDSRSSRRRHRRSATERQSRFRGHDGGRVRGLHPPELRSRPLLERCFDRCCLDDELPGIDELG